MLCFLRISKAGHKTHTTYARTQGLIGLSCQSEGKSSHASFGDAGPSPLGHPHLRGDLTLEAEELDLMLLHRWPIRCDEKHAFLLLDRSSLLQAEDLHEDVVILH